MWKYMRILFWLENTSFIYRMLYEFFFHVLPFLHLSLCRLLFILVQIKLHAFICVAFYLRALFFIFASTLFLLLLASWGWVYRNCWLVNSVIYRIVNFLIFLIYVDDIIITQNNNSLVNDLIVKLNLVFALKDLGDVNFS